MPCLAPRVRAFTLIELLIVVAIIAILAAIAVPNFLEAQVRAKTSKAKADMRTLVTGIESYRLDHNSYPAGTDNAAKYPAEIATFLGPLAGGYYSFMTRDTAAVLGRDFAGITTPIAYVSSITTDPFAGQAAGFLTYCYRNAGITKSGYVLSSVGPDADLLAAAGKGTQNTNVLGTRVDTKVPSRLGDCNERAVVSCLEDAPSGAVTAADIPNWRTTLIDLNYDPTNGSVSDGDLIRVGP